MQRTHNAIQLTAIDDDELARLYAYPRQLDAPWLRANFVSSIDGAATSGGVSGGLGTPADRRVFGTLRELADVVLVGAGTVRAENYGGAATDPERRRALAALGYGGDADGVPPPIAVVTASASLDPESRLCTDTDVPPIVLTTASAPSDRVAALIAAGAKVVEVGTNAITPRGLADALAGLGLYRVLCEGGPHLVGELIDADLLDELCLTTAPMLVGGSGGRIALSPGESAHPMVRRHVLLDDDGTVLTRWARR
ncbi:pyrimidine reductase family protein [Nocardia asteroides]|uniref:pyrimidine reductase family protein n=1 Tax=Nocardia asteroides TaxID=1824 RepID=UPI001E4E4A35|nr:pyrimidine reductase family protein [Nocardia asteroides]UGT63425.1 pyrimidine reductase family protein [Nocardia asteroides]